MIDSHVHLRDWNQNGKETVEHGLSVAYRVGLDGIFEMSNTDPSLTRKEIIIQRIWKADRAIEKLGICISHFLYAGLTADPEQIKEVCEIYYDKFPRVIGLKLFAGRSTGDLGIIKEDEQRSVYATLSKLGYKGVLGVHCEKEAFIDDSSFDPSYAYSHCLARPAKSEIESVKDQIKFAYEANFKGTLHICHVSVPSLLESVRKARDYVNFNITTEVAPHHAVLYDRLMEEKGGLLLKMNPSLRPREMQEKMLDCLLKGDVDMIGTDHAPHTLKDKLEGKLVDGKWKGYASGIPVLPYYPHFISLLREKGASEELIDNLTHNNICKIFSIKLKNTKRNPDYNLAGEYEFDPFRSIKQ